MEALEALFGNCSQKLSALIQDEAAMILGVKEELGKLQRRMKRIDGALKKTGRERTEDAAWLNELRSILDEANDLFDDVRHEGEKLPAASSSVLSTLCWLPMFSFFNSIRVRHNLAIRIRALNNRIGEVAKDRWMFNLESVKTVGRVAASMSSTRETCEIMEADVVGREIEDAQSLRSVGVQIVNKCGGLPLAIKVIAGVLTAKEKSKREWERVLKSNAWSMSELPEEFRGALYLSYHDLPPHLKQCFLSCCLYPEDDVHCIWDLRRMWVAEGFVEQEEGLTMEELAEQYYFELIRRSLLQPDPRHVDQRRCKVHDLLRSLGQYLSQGESYYGDPQSLDATAISKLRRLSIAEGREIVTIPAPETERLRLRTLLLTASPPRIEHSLFSRFPYLQVLRLNGKGIECIPDCVGNLIHLRLLDLDWTSISNLPDSIGLLKNLQTLNLQHCKFLNTLPRSITHLSSLRRLGLSGMSRRIGRLQLINDLQGFIIHADDSCNSERNSWDLEELKSLGQLRRLGLHILEGKRNANSMQPTDDTIDQVRTAAPPGNGAFVLANKAFLKELAVSCTPQTERAEVPPYTEEEISKIEDTFEKLHPPTCLERLWVENFYNQHIPSWMLSSSLGTYLPYLTYVNFIGLPLCPQLPPLGQLPHLRYLQIREALAIVTIGPELLGNGVGAGVHAAAAFPKLEFLFMIGMPNWEEWSLVGSETGKSSSCSLRVMPRLEELRVIYCPKLRALPKGLQQLRALRILKVERAHSLSVIEDFLFVTELRIIKNDGMERISNLPALRKLTIWDNSALKCVDNLVALQYLELQDYSMKSLPEWLLRLAQQRVHLRDNNLELVMRCSAAIIQRCLKGGPDWPIIECFSRVSAYTEDRSAYLEYTKQKRDKLIRNAYNNSPRVHLQLFFSFSFSFSFLFFISLQPNALHHNRHFDAPADRFLSPSPTPRALSAGDDGCTAHCGEAP
ncbi:putative disease resistance RPP13-like protein 1 [Ananas comosus]|uniref:Putative disease resistance RPP13-like protein 1 n=1 Tax=Ananas comosus TaxID=4615 RepID=A0A199VFT2_ANACO|nr:putative disease resistance RPP13-like protein 1 [Ananas comosus]